MNREGIYGVSNFVFIISEHFKSQSQIVGTLSRIIFPSCFEYFDTMNTAYENISGFMKSYKSDKIVEISQDNLSYFPSLIRNYACG